MLKPDSCNGCPLGPQATFELGRGFSEPDGSGTLGVYIIGESLGHEEVIDGKPFRPRAQAGSLLEKTINRLGFKRSQFKLWNLIACQPPGNSLAGAWYEEKAIAHCKTHFNSVLPRGGNDGSNNVIFAVGNLPLKYLTGASGDAKEKQSVSYLRGFVLRGDYGLVVPSFHPSFIRRGKSKYTEVFERDLLRAVRVKKGEVNHPFRAGFVKPQFQDKPSLDDVRAFYYRVKDSERVMLGCDIETPYSKDKDSGDKGDEGYQDAINGDVDSIEGEEEGSRDNVGGSSNATEQGVSNGDNDPISSSSRGPSQLKIRIQGCNQRLGEPIITVQFSLGEWEGISIPYEGAYIVWIHAILALPNTKLWWNGYVFDIPRLRAKGVILRGIQIDLMWLFHHWQPDLDRNLQFVASYYEWPFPWKHYYGTRLGWYGCVDVAVLHWIKNRCVDDMKGLKHPLSGKSVFDGWKRFVHDVNPLLEGASQRGIPISGVEREKVKVTLEGEKKRLYQEVQGVTPLSIRNIGPRRDVSKIKVKKDRKPREKKV